jgi:hypothetical protein
MSDEMTRKAQNSAVTSAERPGWVVTRARAVRRSEPSGPTRNWVFW